MKNELTEAVLSAEVLLGRNEKISVNVIGDGQRELILKDIKKNLTSKEEVNHYDGN